MKKLQFDKPPVLSEREATRRKVFLAAKWPAKSAQLPPQSEPRIAPDNYSPNIIVNNYTTVSSSSSASSSSSSSGDGNSCCGCLIIILIGMIILSCL